jgi:hypothetical protein
MTSSRPELGFCLERVVQVASVLVTVLLEEVAEP